MLVELLKPHVPMPVVEAHDRIEVEKNHVYVIPPDATLTMEGLVLRVDIPAPARPYRRPIDTFFSFACRNPHRLRRGHHPFGRRQRRLVGRSSHQRARRIHDGAGGGRSTAMSGMPQSATSTGSVDYVLAVEDMAAKLVDYKDHMAKVEDRKESDGVRGDAREYLKDITALAAPARQARLQRLQTEYPGPAHPAPHAGVADRNCSRLMSSISGRRRRRAICFSANFSSA